MQAVVVGSCGNGSTLIPLIIVPPRTPFSPNKAYPPSPDPKNVKNQMKIIENTPQAYPRGAPRPWGARPKAAPMLEVCF